MEIQNGPAYPYYYRFEGVCVAYIRNGDQSEEASRQQLSALILKGMNKTFDSLPSPYHIGDVSFTLLAATFKNTLKEDFQPDKDLLSTALVTEDGQVTNGGLLFSDQGVLPQSLHILHPLEGHAQGQYRCRCTGRQRISGCQSDFSAAKRRGFHPQQ